MISMTSSSGNETPRGIEFLLNQNRLNVAISRAMCIASIYMSDELFETECKNLSQMKLLNDLIYLNNNSQ